MKYMQTQYNLFKNNLPMILLLPTIIGGFWQILELSFISISFIRFFSVTQLLPDGLLVLFMFLAVYIVYKFTTLNRMNLRRKNIKVSDIRPKEYKNCFLKVKLTSKLKYVENPTYRKNIIGFHIFIVSFMSVALFLIFKYSPFFKDFTNDFSFSLLLFIFFILFTIGRVFIGSTIVLIIHFFESKTYKKIKKYFLNKPTRKEFALLPIKLVTIAIVIFSISFIIFVASFFHKKYFLPENLKNLDFIQESLNHKNYKSNEILYFNDKYIFIEHKNNNIDISIEILKFDNLFKNEIYNIKLKKD